MDSIKSNKKSYYHYYIILFCLLLFIHFVYLFIFEGGVSIVTRIQSTFKLRGRRPCKHQERRKSFVLSRSLRSKQRQNVFPLGWKTNCTRYFVYCGNTRVNFVISSCQEPCYCVPSLSTMEGHGQKSSPLSKGKMVEFFSSPRHKYAM